MIDVVVTTICNKYFFLQNGGHSSLLAHKPQLMLSILFYATKNLSR